MEGEERYKIITSVSSVAITDQHNFSKGCQDISNRDFIFFKYVSSSSLWDTGETSIALLKIISRHVTFQLSIISNNSKCANSKPNYDWKGDLQTGHSCSFNNQLFESIFSRILKEREWVTIYRLLSTILS